MLGINFIFKLIEMEHIFIFKSAFKKLTFRVMMLLYIHTLYIGKVPIIYLLLLIENGYIIVT